MENCNDARMAHNAKRRVLRRYPNAKLVRSAHHTYWQCSAKEWAGGPVIGEGTTQRAAWIDGARSIKPKAASTGAKSRSST